MVMLVALEKVVFTVESGETGDAVFKSGARLPITGIPEDNPTNDSSPYKLVAKLRDAKVPYTFPFPRGWPNTAQRAMPRRRLPTRYRHRSWRFRSFPFEALRALSCKAEGKASTPTTPVQSLSESRSDEPRTRAVVSRLAAAVTSYMYSVSV